MPHAAGYECMAVLVDPVPLLVLPQLPSPDRSALFDGLLFAATALSIECCGCYVGVCVWMCECECECVCICLPVCACTCARELVSVMIELNGQPLGEPCGNRILRRRPDLPPPLVLTETKDDDQLLSRLCLLKGGNWFRRSGPEPKANGGRWLAHKSCD